MEGEDDTAGQLGRTCVDIDFGISKSSRRHAELIVRGSCPRRLHMACFIFSGRLMEVEMAGRWTKRRSVLVDGWKMLLRVGFCKHE